MELQRVRHDWVTNTHTHTHTHTHSQITACVGWTSHPQSEFECFLNASCLCVSSLPRELFSILLICLYWSNITSAFHLRQLSPFICALSPFTGAFNLDCICACMLSHFSHAQLFANLMTITVRLLCPYDFPGKNTGVGCHALLQKTFPTQESNPGLPHCRQLFTVSAIIQMVPSNHLSARMADNCL